jgi:glycosyltransferase involved in cell wall biosynthesis
MARDLRLLALIAVRNEMRYLPGFLANVSPHVDGIIALDDGSTDESARCLASHPKVIELLSVPADRPEWDEVGNHRALIAASLRHGADWVLSVDADDRLEREFRSRCERVIRKGEPLGDSAYAGPLRELWGSRHTYRVDGIWGRKKRARLFQARPDHEFDTQPLHAVKAPLQARRNGEFPFADLVIYHLKMIRSEDRWARRRRYELADPEARYQMPGVGYAYLTDEQGLRLARVPPDRAYSE